MDKYIYKLLNSLIRSLSGKADIHFEYRENRLHVLNALSNQSEPNLQRMRE